MTRFRPKGELVIQPVVQPCWPLQQAVFWGNTLTGKGQGLQAALHQMAYQPLVFALHHASLHLLLAQGKTLA